MLGQPDLTGHDTRHLRLNEATAGYAWRSGSSAPGSWTQCGTEPSRLLRRCQCRAIQGAGRRQQGGAENLVGPLWPGEACAGCLLWLCTAKTKLQNIFRKLSYNARISGAALLRPTACDCYVTFSVTTDVGEIACETNFPFSLTSSKFALNKQYFSRPSSLSSFSRILLRPR